MLQELFPDAKNVGLLYCTAEANSQYQVDTVQAALEKLGYTCTQYGFSDSNDLSSVATTAADASDVLYVPTDNTVANNTELVNNICEPKKFRSSQVRKVSAVDVELQLFLLIIMILELPLVRWQYRF